MKLIALLVIACSSLFVSCQSTESSASSAAAVAPVQTPLLPEKKSITILPETAKSKSSPEVASSQVKPYPLKNCLVTDEPLDEWDEETHYVHQGQQLKFCCKMCLNKFKKDPAQYLAKLE